MAKLNIGEALHIAERDKTPQCESCTEMADEGERFCRYCKDYWDADVQARISRIDDAFWSEQEAE